MHKNFKTNYLFLYKHYNAQKAFLNVHIHISIGIVHILIGIEIIIIFQL